MTYESAAEPIKIGYLMDFLLPEGFPKTYFEDLTRPFDLVFQQGVEQGLIDRPIKIIYREVEGLPKGSVKAVIDAYGELCDEGSSTRTWSIVSAWSSAYPVKTGSFDHPRTLDVCALLALA